MVFNNNPQHVVVIPNNFPNSSHISPAVAQVERSLNQHYALQQLQQQNAAYSPPYVINDNNRRY